MKRGVAEGFPTVLYGSRKAQVYLIAAFHVGGGPVVVHAG